MSIYYVGSLPYSDELTHHGIIGQKWGIRRYQNPDGSLTAEGRQRYGVDIKYNVSNGIVPSRRRLQKGLNDLDQEHAYSIGNQRKLEASLNRNIAKVSKSTRSSDDPMIRKYNKLQNEKVADIRKEKIRQKNIEKEINKISATVANYGYNTIMSPTYRETIMDGKQLASTLSLALIPFSSSPLWLPGVIGASVAGTALDAYQVGGLKNTVAEGTKYKVRKNK